MANRKKYHDLDEVGFLGVARERTETEIDMDAKRTSEYIKRHRLANAVRGAIQATGSASATRSANATGSIRKRLTKTK